jgi:hypothetical protein
MAGPSDTLGSPWIPHAIRFCPQDVETNGKNLSHHTLSNPPELAIHLKSSNVSVNSRSPQDNVLISEEVQKFGIKHVCFSC